jgi:UDP-N-acetylmuramoyl-L-alanyl-D-glutamate--2,6-diaminopimelate ligase
LVDFGQATVVLESGGSVHRVSEALRTAKATGAGGRVWCVLAIEENDCEETLANYGQSIERFAHHCVVTSKPNQAGSFLKRTHQVLDGVKECAAIRLVADQAKAIQWAIKSSRPRDTIVVITNQYAQTAHESRTQFAQIESLVAATRATLQADADVDQSTDLGQTINLKLFP